MAAEVVAMTDPQSLAQEAARRFVELGAEAVAGRGEFRVALSGGSTPKALYETLSGEPYRSQVDWEAIQVFFSDERFVPPDSPESNFRTANEALLSRVPIPERRVHPVPTVDIAPEEAAASYEEGIRRVFGAGVDEAPAFDLILLGLGPDGHTASLFPGSAALKERHRLVVPNYVAKFDSWRITFTYRLINSGRVVAFLSQGADKAERVRQVLSGQEDLPAAGVQPSNGRLQWLIDEAAASKLAPEVRTGGTAQP